jgi:RNA polymerase sigma-70 factor (ECF subfamily)
MDRDLVERARAGDREAFTDLVHQVSDTLFGVARRILRDPGLAEDVLQIALVTIWRKLPHLRDADHFEAWAFRILVHACYAEAPRNRRWAATVRVLPTNQADAADDFRSIIDRDELEGAFRSLPLDQRAVFVLHHHVGLPLVAVAETLGIPDGTARSRLHYATRALRAAFEAGLVGVSAWSTTVAPGTTVESWMEAYCAGQNAGPCTGIQDDAVDVETRDQHPGRLVFGPDTDTMAFILDGQTMYVVAVWRGETDPAVQPYGGARALLEAFLSTMTLPADSPLGSPGPS